MRSRRGSERCAPSRPPVAGEKSVQGEDFVRDSSSRFRFVLSLSMPLASITRALGSCLRPFARPSQTTKNEYEVQGSRECSCCLPASLLPLTLIFPSQISARGMKPKGATSIPPEKQPSLTLLLDRLPLIVTVIDQQGAPRYQNSLSVEYFSSSSSHDVLGHLLSLQPDPTCLIEVRACTGQSTPLNAPHPPRR